MSEWFSFICLWLEKHSKLTLQHNKTDWWASISDHDSKGCMPWLQSTVYWLRYKSRQIYSRIYWVLSTIFGIYMKKSKAILISIMARDQVFCECLLLKLWLNFPECLQGLHPDLCFCASLWTKKFNYSSQRRRPQNCYWSPCSVSISGFVLC